LKVTLEHFSTTRAAQERALEILQFKLDILWQMNDAMALRYGIDPVSAATPVPEGAAHAPQPIAGAAS
jgi:pyrroloquinoline quinone (PQQ) biosynthesis protein C